MIVVVNDTLGISSMELNDRKEQFSNAYSQAVASVAGFGMYKPAPDVGIDWGISGYGENGTAKSPRLEVQLKCTAATIPNSDDFSFALKLKTYNDLRAERVDLTVPRILVVFLVPDDIESWLEQSEENLIMRHCGYWASLRGMDEVENTSSVTVHLPRSNLFTVDALNSIMQGIGDGDWP